MASSVPIFPICFQSSYIFLYSLQMPYIPYNFQKDLSQLHLEICEFFPQNYESCMMKLILIYIVLLFYSHPENKHSEFQFDLRCMYTF